MGQKIAWIVPSLQSTFIYLFLSVDIHVNNTAGADLNRDLALKSQGPDAYSRSKSQSNTSLTVWAV